MPENTPESIRKVTVYKVDATAESLWDYSSNRLPLSKIMRVK